MKLKLYGFMGLMLSIVGCGMLNQSASASYEEYVRMLNNPITTAEQACKIFPQSIAEVKTLAINATRAARERLDALLAIAPEARTFANTVEAYDRIGGAFGSAKGVFEMLGLVCPEKPLRDAIHENFVVLKNSALDLFEDVRLYDAFQVLERQPGFFEKLTEAQRYYFNEVMRDFKRQGLNLPLENREKVQKLKKEINALTAAFSANVAGDKSGIEVLDEQLDGINPDVLKNLKKTADGKRFVGCDYPTYNEIMRFCTVGKTRKALRKAYNNRAYPVNDGVLKKVMKLRQELATLLGFENFAKLDIDGSMAHTVETVENFLKNLLDSARDKATKEFEMLAKDLAPGVALNADGTMNLWDFAFTSNYYKKKYFDVDEAVIAQYFPVDKALAGMLDVYQDFFGLRFEEVAPTAVWHPSVRLIKVTRVVDQKLLGHLFLDLYPRADKYTHACCGAVYPAFFTKDAEGVETEMPAVVMVVANFPKSKEGKPALLTFTDVTTFFHEFGHAMHTFLSKTPFMSTGIDAVKIDFVEMPSQMFESWMYQPEILQKISSHYETGKPLPIDLVNKKIALKKFASGNFVLGQLCYAQTSLQLYSNPKLAPEDLTTGLSREYFPFMSTGDMDHSYAAFEHLVGYGAKYYGYMWSRVFAQDVFDHLLASGLGDPKVGKRFADILFAPGGGKDPAQMLEEFLGRAPSQDAFMKSYGLIE
jgi:thimet oligopeptidase